MRIGVHIAGRNAHINSEGELRALLRELVARNVLLMQRDPRAFPPLTSTRVRYRREPIGVEDWQDAAALLARGFGDCEDIASYEAARLFVAGKRAQVMPKRVEGGWHIVVLLDGSHVYDPCRLLGM